MSTMKIGAILGESVVEGYEQEIDITGWTWDLMAADDNNASKVATSITVQKRFDKSTPELMRLTCSAMVMPQAIISVFRAVRSKLTVAIRIILFDVQISKISCIEGDGGWPLEILTLCFDSFHVEYVEQTATGTAGSTTVITWQNNDDVE